MEQAKRFKMIDEKFICDVCGKKVEKLGYTARDHCPYCLSSKHVDINPGDRQSLCKGVLEPIGIENAKKGQYKILYKCKSCGEIKKNIIGEDESLPQFFHI